MSGDAQGKSAMYILGLNCGFSINTHDTGAALLKGGEIVAVCEEERYSRIKSARGLLPTRAIRQCLDVAGISMDDVAMVASPGESRPEIAERIRLFLEHRFSYSPPIQLYNHQLAHLASAYYCSGFDEAMCLAYDNSGDRLSAMLGHGRGGELRVLRSIDNRNSLGAFYALLTQFLGFEAGEDEYKVMGLAPYGKPGIDLSDLLALVDDGFRLNNAYFRSEPPLISVYEPMFNDRLKRLLGTPRQEGEEISGRHLDIAYAAQVTLEQAGRTLVAWLHRETGARRLCIAGGVGLNCSANYHLGELDCVDDMFIQPAASDRGLALGSAFLAARAVGYSIGRLEHVFYNGPEYDDRQIRAALDLSGYPWEICSDPAREAARQLVSGRIVGWFQGRSEFGPRALGHRSILADPRDPAMKDVVNARIKFREEFRPFAPSVLAERAEELFEMCGESPFMTRAFPVRPEWRGRLGAVTHVNGTARVQTVNQEYDHLYYALISEFAALTGVPAILNTSFNVRGQPIVETPSDALGTFAACGLDDLFIGRYHIAKIGR
jgi:carbamoyltransferase